MKRCKTCKWWERDVEHIGPEQCRPCNSSKIGEPYHLYKRSTDKDLDILSYTYDEAGYILTGPDFGCVHHEDRDPRDV